MTSPLRIPHATHGKRRWRHFRSLQARLFVWFLGAIVLAIAASAVVTVLTNTEPSEVPAHVAPRHTQHRFARPARLWRVFVALGVAVLVLGTAARRVSKRLARPLEHLAQTATRFGAGDLRARTGIDTMPRRWVAEEVRDVGSAFDTMADRIARVVVEQRELLAAISHELRSPLGRARVAAEIAREQIDAEPRVATAQRALSALDDVDRQLVEVDAILGDLLASARASLADLHAERHVLVSWLRARIAQEKGPIELHVARGAESATTVIDSALFGRAVHNIFANAWAHGHPKECAVMVDVSLHGDHVRIAVRDRGPGFPASILPRAFDAFIMGGDAARSPRAHGIGLGLALVRRIIEAHRGAVSASNLTKNDTVVGAEVTIELPTSKGDDGIDVPHA
ncbi:MAG: HAMP domain-containing histidine kinase [Polyangiaceae bacterium]|nr:HAMP domain-containing histidine kinase [Polyangiaceae bacterium]